MILRILETEVNQRNAPDRLNAAGSAIVQINYVNGLKADDGKAEWCHIIRSYCSDQSSGNLIDETSTNVQKLHQCNTTFWLRFPFSK